MELQQKRNDILRIAAQHGARNLRVFGSVARGDDRAHSDVDLLVDMDPDRSLLDTGLGQDLEELLDGRVDVLTGASLHPAPRDRILAESRPLWRTSASIGEAVNQLPNATKERRPEIPWKRIAGMRDRLTPDYFGVDLALVWRVVERDLRALKTAVTALL